MKKRLSLGLLGPTQRTETSSEGHIRRRRALPKPLEASV